MLTIVVQSAPIQPNSLVSGWSNLSWVTKDALAWPCAGAQFDNLRGAVKDSLGDYLLVYTSDVGADSSRRKAAEKAFFSQAANDTLCDATCQTKVTILECLMVVSKGRLCCPCDDALCMGLTCAEEATCQAYVAKSCQSDARNRIPANTPAEVSSTSKVSGSVCSYSDNARLKLCWRTCASQNLMSLVAPERGLLTAALSLPSCRPLYSSLSSYLECAACMPWTHRHALKCPRTNRASDPPRDLMAGKL